MKTKFTLLTLILLLISVSMLANERFKGDTVRIQFKNFRIEVITTDLTQNTLTDAQLGETAVKIGKWLDFAKVAEPQPDEMIYIKISEATSAGIQGFKNVTFENKKRNKRSIVISEDDVLTKDFGNYRVELLENNFTIRYYLNDLKDLNTLSSGDFTKQIREAEKLIPSGRKKLNGWMQLNDAGEFETHFLDETPPFTLDMLYLSAGVGAGIIKNQWVNDINFKIGFGFASKGIERNLYFAEFKMYYDFPGANAQNSFSINSFVSIGLEHNFSKNMDKAKWFGMSVGYLLDRNSDFFEKNTWKLAMHKRINQTISVNPELYFNGFFKNIYPGVQLGIAF